MQEPTNKLVRCRKQKHPKPKRLATTPTKFQHNTLYNAGGRRFSENSANMSDKDLHTLCVLPWSGKEEDWQLWSMKF